MKKLKLNFNLSSDIYFSFEDNEPVENFLVYLPYPTTTENDQVTYFGILHDNYILNLEKMENYGSIENRGNGTFPNANTWIENTIYGKKLALFITQV